MVRAKRKTQSGFCFLQPGCDCPASHMDIALQSSTRRRHCAYSASKQLVLLALTAFFNRELVFPFAYFSKLILQTWQRKSSIVGFFGVLIGLVVVLALEIVQAKVILDVDVIGQ